MVNVSNCTANFILENILHDKQLNILSIKSILLIVTLNLYRLEKKVFL